MKYRWRSKLRAKLPFGLYLLIPKGTDCYPDPCEWYLAEDLSDGAYPLYIYACYHCKYRVSTTIKSPPQ